MRKHTKLARMLPTASRNYSIAVGLLVILADCPRCEGLREHGVAIVSRSAPWAYAGKFAFDSGVPVAAKGTIKPSKLFSGTFDSLTAYLYCEEEWAKVRPLFADVSASVESCQQIVGMARSLTAVSVQGEFSLWTEPLQEEGVCFVALANCDLVDTPAPTPQTLLEMANADTAISYILSGGAGGSIGILVAMGPLSVWGL